LDAVEGDKIALLSGLHEQLIGYMIRIRNIYKSYRELSMGIVKIGEELHGEIRKASAVMVRSINAQAEYWIKVGMLAEANPNMTFSEIISEEMKQADVTPRKVIGV
jgi:hypothetical protein